MINTVIKTPTKSKEYFGYTDTDIIVSSKKHDDINSMVGAIEKSGMLETLSHIKLEDVTELKYNEKNGGLNIKHNKKGKNKSFKITFGDADTRNAIASGIGEKKGLSKSFTTEGKAKPLLISIGIALLAGLIFTALTGIAWESANGIEVEEFSGRRSGLKNILAKVASAIGPVGVGIIGGLVILFILFRAFKRWQNPANDVVYS